MKGAMTKKEYNLYLFVTFVLLIIFFVLIILAVIFEGTKRWGDAITPLTITAFIFGAIQMLSFFLNYRRAEGYIKIAKAQKIDNEECAIINDFKVENVKCALKAKGFSEDNGIFIKEINHPIRAIIKYSVNFCHSDDIEKTLEEYQKKFDNKHHMTYSQCNILIISLDIIGNDDIKNTHTPFERRDKFKNYSGKNSYNYYTSHTFEFLDEEYDMALTKVEEITPLFEYMLANDINNLEVVVDLDLMIGEYEKAKGAYDPNKDISYNVSTGYIYYYTLRDYFNQNVLKPNKFASQYIFLNYSASGIKYNANGDVGLVYTFTQNLLIDEEKEIEQLVNFLSDHKVNGTYTLYINNQMFGKSIGQYVALAEKLFEDALKNKDIQFDFEFVESNNEYGDKATDIATVYNLKVICN